MLRPSSRAIALCVAIIAFALSTQAAGAATIAVTTEADENGTNTNACSLREAVRSANGNTSVGGCTQGDGADTITVPAGLYLLTVTSGTASGDLDLTTNITINGAGQAQTVIDGTSLNDRVFDVSDANANVTITGLTVQHGHAAGNGGGIRNQGTLTLRDVLVFENTADDDGGGVYNDDGRSLTLVRTSIRDNIAGADGGGLFNDEGGTVKMTDGDISGNDADEDAGGLRNEPDGTVNLTRVTIDGNETQQDAGGVRNDGTMTMDQVTVSGNIAADTSGGIENRGTLHIADSTIEDNEAGDDGGGIQNSDGAELTVVRSAIVRNTTQEDGGGIDVDDGTVTLTNVTISGNQAAVDGGGIEGSDGGTIDLLHVTIANNTAGGQGDGIFNDPSPPATIRIRSTIVANNGAGPNCDGDPITSQGFNLEFPNNSCDLGASGDLPNTDPRLGPLASNGARTPTHALLAGSPAIDVAANAGCPSTDQRGEPRPADGNRDGISVCDIGAYEVTFRATEAVVRNDPNNDDEKPKETAEQRQQRERTNDANIGEYRTEGNVLEVERAPDGEHLLVTIGLVKKETLVVQVTCIDLKCPDIREGDYLEADGYQNGVGDPNAYFIAEDVTILRNGKKVK